MHKLYTIHRSHPSQPQSRIWNIASMLLYILGVYRSVFSWTQRRPRSSGSGPGHSETFTAHQSTCWSSCDQAYQCRTWHRCAARQRTVDAATHQQTHGTMLLPSQTPEEDPTYTGPHYHMQTGVRFCFESTRLLQLNSCWPSKVHQFAPTTRPECSGTSGVRSRLTWPGDKICAWATLATNPIPQHVQVVPDDAQRPHRM